MSVNGETAVAHAHEYFYITHFAGCAVLFNKDTFHSDMLSSPFTSTTTEMGNINP